MKKFTYLKESPIFQLSLTSKELYHSNFIYWIVSNYKEEFSKLISKLIPNIKVITDIKREEKNKDIVIYFKDSNGKEMKVILENKVKSIPTYEQLLKYTTQDISESYILLSLARPTFVSKDNKIKIKELDREWIYLDYARLASMLEEILTEVYSKNTYHFLILSDYIQVIKELDNIKNEIYNNIEYGVYDLYKKENQLVGLLKEIRLHDFYFKLYHNIIASEIHHRLRDELSNVILVSNKDWKKSKSQEVFTGSGFTNGSGISEVKYVIGEKYGSPVILGIQIQGIQFRIFIESKKGMAIKIAEKLHSNSLWFNFSNVISSGIAESEEYPISKKSSLKKFNTYSNEFYYRYVKLNNCKIKDLIEIVMDYVHIIHREKENIIRALEEI